MRLFLALELPVAGLDRLQKMQGLLKQQGRGRFAPRENLHLTAVFLGEADPAEVLRCLRHIAPQPLTLTVTGFDRFGDLVYAAVRPSAALTQLHNTLKQALSDGGFHTEKREFLPHITLCRKYTGSIPRTALPFTVSGARLVLMSSQLHPKGAVYTPIYKF